MFVYIYMQVTYWSDKLTFSFWVKDLVGGPLHKVKTGPMYFTRGYLLHTQNHGARRRRVTMVSM